MSTAFYFSLSTRRYLNQKPAPSLTAPSFWYADRQFVDEGLLTTTQEMMSEHSIIMSQMSAGNTSTDSAGRPIQPLGLTQAERYAQAKPKFTEFECSYEEVRRIRVCGLHSCSSI